MVKKKISIIDYVFYFLLCIAGGFLGYLVGGAMYTGGRNPIKVCEDFLEECNQPFSMSYWNEYSFAWIAAGAATTVLCILCVVLSKKNFMFGKEYGTAKWADVHALNKSLDNQYNKKDPDKREHQLVFEKKRILGKPKKIVINTYNMRLSKHLYLSLDTRYTDLNNNILVVGGSGAGKTFRFVKPNFMSLGSTFISTDPKGELLRDTAGFLKYFGYVIKAFDLRNADGLKKSTKYNPFRYLKDDIDVRKLISNIMSNTTEKGVSPSDPFWEKAEGMYLQAVFFYVWKVGVFCEKTDRLEHNMWAVVQIINKTVVIEDNQGNRVPCIVDQWFKNLEANEPDNKAVTYYNNSMSGAADTVRSIVISAKARMAPLDEEHLLDFFWEDEMDIENFGQEKTAMYCVLPDNDKTYNFVAGIFYTQCFQVLYDIADNIYEGPLPVHVRMMFDEFANVALPKEFMTILSTMRSRNMSATIIIQGQSQIKSLFKDDWETINGNTDTFIYLGGNEKSTHKDVNEQLGKETIDKRSTSESRGKQGSTSHSDDGLGRDLLFADEIRKLPRSKCIILINGMDPVIDDKVFPITEPLWSVMVKMSKKYRFDARLDRYYKKQQKEKGFYSENEIKMMKLREHQRKKHFEYEKMVAEKTETTFDEEYIPNSVEISLYEAFELSEMNDSELDVLRIDITKEQINENRQAAIEQMQKEIEEQEEIEREIEENTIDIGSFQTAEEAELYMMLSNNHFEIPQIKLLMRLVTEVQYGKPEMIASMFRADMSIEEMTILVNLLISSKKKQGNI